MRMNNWPYLVNLARGPEGNFSQKESMREREGEREREREREREGERENKRERKRDAILYEYQLTCRSCGAPPALAIVLTGIPINPREGGV